VQEEYTRIAYAKTCASLVCFVLRMYFRTLPAIDGLEVRFPDPRFSNFQEHIANYQRACLREDEELQLASLGSLIISIFIDKGGAHYHAHSFLGVLFVILVAAKDEESPLDSDAARTAIAGLLYVYRLLLLMYLNYHETENSVVSEMDLTPQFLTVRGAELSLNSENFVEFVTIEANSPFSGLAMAQKLCRVSAIPYLSNFIHLRFLMKDCG
jgi:hypothetical protein